MPAIYHPLRDSFRARLGLPDGRIGAIAAVHTFGDFLFFHPYLHILAADGLFTPDGRFHCMPAESYVQMAELFRHRFLHALREAKLISPAKLADLRSWQHRGWRILRQAVSGAARPASSTHSAPRPPWAGAALAKPPPSRKSPDRQKT